MVPDKELARLKCYAVLMGADILALAISFLLANFLYLKDIRSPHGLTMLLVLGPIYLGIAAIKRAYASDVLEPNHTGISRALQSFFFAASSILLIVYMFKASNEFSRIVFIMGMSMSAVLIASFRLMLRRPLLNTLDGTPMTTVVIKDDVAYAYHDPAIVLTTEELAFEPTTQDPIRYHAFAELVANADRVIVACSSARYADWASVLKGLTTKGEILTDERDSLELIGLGSHNGMRTMVVSTGPLHLNDRLIKRAFDVAFASVALIAIMPLLIAAAVLIKLESPGPVLFIQKRIGRDNRLFSMFKFRSMYTEMCDVDAATLTGRNDSRVTRVGAFIRRTSIDELPQLLNVLRGDMSIVGPRPHALSAKAADLLYWDVDPQYRHRHSVKPGLTGLAQVRGYRGNTERAEDLTNRLRADLEYVANWSLWNDVWIILKTIQVMRHVNAF